jgi:hypothetical protein
MLENNDQRIVSKYFSLIIFLGGVFCFPLKSEAREVVREADCKKNVVCIEEYKKEKEEWIACLEEAGLSEKKRQRLSLKVERAGIKNLKKQEFLIFNSKRKTCHKIFKKAISTLKPELEQESLKEFPAVLEDLNSRLPSQ